jgi:cell pole-organizing protein PopZ
MTKPHFSAEPSMEDILASIRKMISEERMGPRPVPDQMATSPFGQSMTPEAAATSLDARPERSFDPAERSGPSFSSLSDALKAATPSGGPRRSLEDKIADMLGPDEVPSRPSAPDPLAVFSANRPTFAPSSDPTPFGLIPRDIAPERQTTDRRPPERPIDRSLDRPDPARPPEAPINGSLNGAGRRRDDLAPRQGATSGSPSKYDDSERIIAMPPRSGVANGAVNGTVPQTGAGNGAAPAANGAKVSSLGPRPFPGSTPGLRAPDAQQTKRPDTAANASGNGLTAKSGDRFNGKPGDGGARAKAGDTAAEKPLKADPHTQTARDKAGFMARAPFDPKTAHTKSEDRPAKTATQPDGAKPKGSTPSDALVDAVVALVHTEPDSLSVFTSGSAFIHGVIQEQAVEMPGPNAAGKLDGSAAELLRPMLRQWLSDNMPRIVEEALRSEMTTNSESPPKDPGKK